MKKIISLTILFSCLCISISAGNTVDSVAPPASTTAIPKTDPSVGNKTTDANKPADLSKTPDGFEKLISSMPLILFLIILLSMILKLRKEEVDLSDLLVEKPTAKQIQASAALVGVTQNQGAPNVQAATGQAAGPAVTQGGGQGFVPAVVGAVPPNAGNAGLGAAPPAAQPQSTSRFVALLSGVTTIALSASIATFYMYSWFKGINPDLSHLSTVLLGLGLGIVPYGINKLSTT